MRRILFVDDEPRILDGLSRMLRGLRGEWEMVFAKGGPEALECCARAPFDVVVSDARMPGMDGSELLDELTRLCPDTVRIMLSGQCNRDAVMKAVAVAHQFLTKPCDPRSLKSTVQKVCLMREQFRDIAARQRISSVQKLPSQPAAYDELADELKSAKASIGVAANIVARDVAMCAKTVQLVSSGFFGTPQRVADAAHAARLLGLETLKALLDSSLAIVPGDFSGCREEELRLLNEHSLAVAAAAKRIAETVTRDQTLINDAHLSGVLHDIAALAQCSCSSDSFEAPSSIQGGQAASAWQPEDGPDAGGYLAALWGLPDPIIQAIGYHRVPGRCPNQNFAALTAVHVAHAMLRPPLSPSNGERGAIDVEYLDRAGCADRVESWRQICAAVEPEGVLQ